MDRRTKGIIVTAVSVVLCGCTGLVAGIFGLLGVLGVPFSTEINGTPTGTAPMPVTWGFSLLCLSLIMIAIPIVIGFVTLRKKAAPANINEPMPPAS